MDFVIDKLTNSIENIVTGESFSTEITLLLKSDLNNLQKKNGWVFNWKTEFSNPSRSVYKLTTKNNLSIIQGLISIELRQDHVFMHLLENAPFNKGKAKMYAGVAGNLVAFACKYSFQMGHEGNIAFVSKTKLIAHYEKELGAFHAGGHVMIIEKSAAIKLIEKYF